VPCWLQTTQALLTPLIGLVVAYVAFQQWLTNRRRLKLELFDRRYAVYRATKDAILEVVHKADISDDSCNTYIAATGDSEFLFGQDVVNYLKELWSNMIEVSTFHRLYEQGEIQRKPEEERLKAIADNHEHLKWFTAQLTGAKDVFSAYLQFKQRL
jgi:hypothetical protein